MLNKKDKQNFDFSPTKDILSLVGLFVYSIVIILIGGRTMLKMKRIYEDVEKHDHFRVLVDRIWPRGVSKEDAQLDEWKKGIAPSDKVRKSYDHDPDKFDEFKKDYLNELKNNKDSDDFVDLIKKQLKKGNVTLLYGAKDKNHNQAIVLMDYLASRGVTEAKSWE